MKSTFLAALAISGCLALLSCSPATAQPPGIPADCHEICATPCLKPWSIPDRWDDSGRPGWPKWMNDKRWDSEKFTDQNGNELYDAGEPFQDGVDTNKGTGPKDGQYTSEFYHPFLTGYIAGRDLGQLMTFKVASPHSASAPSQFYPIDLCFEGKCTGGDVYRWNIGNCNPTLYGPGDWIPTENANMIGPTKQGMKELLDQDPGAYWDADCRCVRGSAFPSDESPRVVRLALHDPRIPLDSGKMEIQIVKLAAMFLEDQSASGDIVGRFMLARTPGGERCTPGETAGGYLYDCPPARAFLRGGDQVTRLGSGRPATCVQVEPLADLFRLADLDPESVTMTLVGGDGRSIPGVLARPGKDRDTDRNGVDEATVCFAKDDLRTLLGPTPGRATVPVTLGGGLLPGEFPTLASWTADLDLDVAGAKARPQSFLTTTPLSDAVRIRFATSQPGTARVRVYDARGRLVRTLLDDPAVTPGEHEAAWDRRDAAGRRAGRGIYFYRVETPEGVATGRIAILG